MNFIISFFMGFAVLVLAASNENADDRDLDVKWNQFKVIMHNEVYEIPCKSIYFH